jgi:hypothetical protein
MENIMRLHLAVSTFIVATLLAAAPLFAADAPPIDKDLKATIALQGMSCDSVSEAKRNADSDYSVTCKDGNRYHVYVNAQGRVVVQKL